MDIVDFSILVLMIVLAAGLLLFVTLPSSMPVVSFPWDAQLVSVRREVCPNARWDKAQRVWLMTDEEAAMFRQAAHARMYFGRVKCTVNIDCTLWVLGFEQGTPYRLGVVGKAP